MSLHPLKLVSVLMILATVLVVPLASADVTVWGCARTDCQPKTSVPAPIDCDVWVPVTVGGGVHAVETNCLPL